MSETSTNGNGTWKTLAVALLTADITFVSYWLMFGMDAVRHSEIDQIMSTRAPYIHDRQRIEEKFANEEARLKRIEELHWKE